MTNNINNFGTINFFESNNRQQKSQPAQVEDITPIQEDKPAPVDSIIFTKKAKKEGKEPFILHALQNAVQGRRDKTRAFVDELHAWQKEQYIDAR